MVDAGGVVIWLGSAREDLVRGTVCAYVPRFQHSTPRWTAVSKNNFSKPIRTLI